MRRQAPAASPAGGAFGPGRQVSTPPGSSSPAERPGNSGAPAPLPSAKLKPALDSPFARAATAATPFAASYANGTIPCRINHGSVRHTLSWSVSPEELCFDPLLVLCAEGIRETLHPHTFVARSAYAELLGSSGAQGKALPLLPLLVVALRAALGSADAAVVAAALLAVRQLAQCVGEHLVSHFAVLLVQVNRHDASTKQQALRDDARATLLALEQFGGPQALPAIKARLPAYGRGLLRLVSLVRCSSS